MQSCKSGPCIQAVIEQILALEDHIIELESAARDHATERQKWKASESRHVAAYNRLSEQYVDLQDAHRAEMGSIIQILDCAGIPFSVQTEQGERKLAVAERVEIAATGFRSDPRPSLTARIRVLENRLREISRRSKALAEFVNAPVPNPDTPYRGGLLCPED